MPLGSFTSLLRNNRIALEGINEWLKLKTESFCLLFETFDSAFFLLLVIIGSPRVLVINTMLKHVVDDSSKFVRGSNNRLGRAMTCFAAPIESTKGALGTSQGLGRNAQGSCRPVVGFASAPALDLAARDWKLPVLVDSDL